MPLEGFTILVAGHGAGAAYAGHLLSCLGARVVRLGAGPVPELEVGTRPWVGDHDPSTLARLPVAGAVDQTGVLPDGAGYPVVRMEPDGHPHLDWARSGAMALTGDPERPPLAAPGWQAAFLGGASAVASLLAALTQNALPVVDGPALLGERAAITGLHRQGRTSVGGASRLLAGADGWVAVSLARPADFEALPAWIGTDVAMTDPWQAVAAYLARVPAGLAMHRAQLLGIAAAAVPPFSSPHHHGPDEGRAPSPWCINGAAPPRGNPAPLGSAVELGPTRSSRPRSAVVVDLSSLWAGPLCAGLLAAAGARVIKVESPSRPDGARRGPRGFFDLLNGAKEAVAIDMDDDIGRSDLRRLIDAADVVVESARPRVMRQWGIDVETVVARRRRLVWVSLTGYGRAEPWGQRVAFGDDAAAGAGLVAVADDGEPRFCADAYADPAAGLHAALAALAGLAGGGSYLIDIPLAGVCRTLLSGIEEARIRGSASVSGGPLHWCVQAQGRHATVEPPRARSPETAAAPLGRDTRRVLAEVRGR